MLARIGLIGILLIVILVPLAIHFLSDRVENKYADLSHTNDAWARGWLPRWLPSDATNIREVHDTDTNETWGVFTFGDAGSRDLARVCADVSVGYIRFPRRRPGRWWPTDLVGVPDNPAEYRLMSCRDEVVGERGKEKVSDVFGAIKGSSHAVYFWRVSG